MYRTVFIPTESDNKIPLNIPREWYGKNIEVIVFPLDMPQTASRKTTEKDVYKFKTMLPQYLFDTKNFKFNRDEANNYE